MASPPLCPHLSLSLLPQPRVQSLCPHPSLFLVSPHPSARPSDAAALGCLEPAPPLLKDQQLVPLSGAHKPLPSVLAILTSCLPNPFSPELKQSTQGCFFIQVGVGTH